MVRTLKFLRQKAQMGFRMGFLVCALLTAIALPVQAQSAPQVPAPQADHKPLPIITGTTTSSMDAPETNDQLEAYAHAPAIAKLSHQLGLSTNKGSTYFEDLNSGILVAVILYFLLKYLPGKYRARREKISQDLVEAHRATADAQERLNRIEQKLSSMGAEVDALRKQAAANSAGEEQRIHIAMEDERARIVRSAEAEISAAQAAAQRGLKRFAAELAVERAAEQIRLTEAGDRALVDTFLTDLAGELGARGKN